MSSIQKLISQEIHKYIEQPTEENLNNIKSTVEHYGSGYLNSKDSIYDDYPLLEVAKTSTSSYEGQFTPKKKLELMKTLVELGADANKQDKYGKTALMYTAGHTELTKLLLDNTNIYLRDAEGKTAVNYLDPEQKKLVLFKDAVHAIQSGRCDANTKDMYKNTPLINYGDWAAPFFIAAGADVNAQGEDGNTALMCMKNPEMIKAVIKAGADPNIKNEFGNTSLNLAILESNIDKANILFQAGADIATTNNKGQTLLMHAHDKESVDLILKTAKEKGMDIKAMLDAKDNDGKTLLMYKHDKESIDLILKTAKENGMDVKAMLDAKDNNGKTALAHAFERDSRAEVIQTFLAHGANPYAKDNQGNSAFKYVKSKEAYAVIQPILFNEAISVVEKETDAALRVQKAQSLVMDVKNKEQAQALINLGVDPNARYNQDRTVLMAVANNDNLEAAKAWIEVGANTKLKDANGKNAMDYAKTSQMRCILSEVSVRQHITANTPQTQTTDTPAKQTQTHQPDMMNAVSNSHVR